MKRTLVVLTCVLSFMVSQNANAAWWDRVKTPKAQPAKTEKAKVKKKAVPVVPAKKVVKPAPKVVKKKPAIKAAAKKTSTEALVSTNVPPNLSEKEMVTRLNNIFNNRKDIIGAVSGIDTIENEKGKFFTYNKTPIEKLSKDALLRLTAAVNQQISMKNMERQQKQQRNLKQIQQMNKNARQQKQLKNLNQINKHNRQQRAQKNLRNATRAARTSRTRR
ncbi:MAG: hypothetical protein KAI70_07835 [Candidatus Omnitrophica bacterium]|nr:hypothetical protein [Candidatus Omnitrophota bacterium]